MLGFPALGRSTVASRGAQRVVFVVLAGLFACGAEVHFGDSSGHSGAGAFGGGGTSESSTGAYASSVGVGGSGAGDGSGTGGATTTLSGGAGGAGTGGASSTGAAGGCGGGCVATTGCAGAGDPLWSNVLAYVPCSASIADVSGKSILTLRNAPTVSSSPAGAPGGASCQLGSSGYGAGNGFTVAMPSALGSGDFTVEFSIYVEAWHDPLDQASQILITSTTYPHDGAAGFPSFWSGTGHDSMRFTGGAAFIDSGSASLLQQWTSYAASRVSGTTYLFRNGVLLTSFSDAENYSDTAFEVSYQMNGAYNAVMGSMAQIRVTRAGRYTGSYAICPSGFSTSE